MNNTFRNRNLLVVTDIYNYFVKDQLEVLSRNFCNIYVFVRYNPLVEISRFIPISNFRYYEQFSKTRLINFHSKPENVHIIILKKFYLIPDNKNSYLGDQLAKDAVKYIKKNNIKIDIIHAHFIYPSGYIGVKLKKEFDLPLILTAHGGDIYDYEKKNDVWKNIIRYVLDNSDHVITVSMRNKEFIDLLGLDECCSIIPNGFSARKFYPMDRNYCREVLSLPIDKKVLLTIGSLSNIKGHAFLIDSMKLLTECRSDLLCLLIGQGPEEKILKKIIAKKGLSSSVILCGQKLHEEIPMWMNACDIFVLPSLNEGNPTVMFECLGCGKPFVGTNVGGVPDIICSEDYGLVVEPANPEALAKQILYAIDYDWDSCKILNYANNFTWEKIAESILCVYSKHISQNI